MKTLSRLSLIALVSVAFLLAGCSEERTTGERVAAARASIDNYRYRDAIIEMRNLLRAQPDLMTARVVLGEALLSVGDMAAAEKEYLRARDLGAPPKDYLEALARVWQSRGAHAETLAEIDPDVIDDPAMASTLRALRGRSMLEMGSRDDAQAIFDAELAGRHSGEAQRIALLGKASIAYRDGDADGAEAFIERALDIAPDSAESMLALGRVYLAAGKYAEAKNFLEGARDTRMRARRQDWFFIEAQLTEAYLGLRELEAARESAQTLVRLAKGHSMATYLQGRVEFDSGDLNSAIELFQQLLTEFPDYAPALTLMGVAMIERGDFDQAEMHLSHAVARDPTNVRTRRLLAETRMRIGRSDAAIDTLKGGLRNNSASPDLITLLGRESLRIGDQSQGMRYLRDALAAEPDNLQTNLALASAHLAQGDAAQAVKVLEALPETAIDDKRRQILIRVAKLDLENQANAQAQIEQLLDDAPDDLYVIGLAGSFFAATGQLDEARANFERVLVAAPYNRSAMLNMLNLDERSGDYAQSKPLFESAHRENPDDLLPTLVLARIYEAQGDTPRAMEMVAKAHESNPTALLPKLMLAAQAIRDGDFASAEVYAGTALADYPNSARAHALSGLANLRLKRLNDATASFRRAVLYDPAVAQYRYLQGLAEWTNERPRMARTSFGDALRLDDKHLASMRSLAILEAQAGKTARSNDLMRRIEETFGDSRVGQTSIADIILAQGDIEGAIAYYERAQAIELHWPVALKLYRLRVGNDLPDPIVSLRSWIAHAPDDAVARLKIAQAYHQSGQIDEAIAEYEAVVALDADAALAMNNLAWLFLDRDDAGDLDRAVEISRKAHELLPDNAGIADTYGWMLFRDNRVKEGTELLRKAFLSTTAESSPDVAYHFAAALNANGNATAAKDVLSRALVSEEPFASRDEAQALRDSL